ncbi:DUF4179 domain-containing protein [Sporosarcina sp. FA9]|uniref:DUF4179 domain-containing protein n=1 Tax=Sporosarcina sp. FA9 TaxID=3413030 RepID=UPI003F65ABD0
MTDKIPAFKSEIDKIHVPSEKLDAIISQTLRKNVPKRKKSMCKKLIYTASAAVVALGLLVGSATVSPVMANFVLQIPLLGSIFSESGDLGLVQVSNLGLTQAVGVSKAVKGDTITIDEIFYDGARFTVSYSLETKEPLGENYFEHSGPDFTVDGKTVSYSGGLSETDVTPTYRTGVFSIDAITELPEEFIFGLHFKSLDNKRWKFKIPVKAQSGVEVVTINHTQKAEGIDLSVSDLKISPAGLLIHFNAVSNENFFLTSSIDFHVVNEEGIEIGSHSGGSKGTNENGKVNQSGNRLFDPISDSVKILTVTPYVSHSTEGGGVEIDKDGTETKIEFKPYDGKRIEFDSFTISLP